MEPRRVRNALAMSEPHYRVTRYTISVGQYAQALYEYDAIYASL